MRTIIARETFGEIELTFWKRARKAVGVGFGLVVCCASLLQQSSEFGFGLALSTGLLTGAVSGFVFAWIWYMMMLRASRKTLDKIFDGDLKVIVPPPSDSKFDLRLPCSFFQTPNVATGGILYLGKSEALFVPHRKYRGEKPIRIDADGLAIWAQDWHPNWWGQLLVASDNRILELRSGSESFKFAVPDVDSVVSALRGSLGQ